MEAEWRVVALVGHISTCSRPIRGTRGMWVRRLGKRRGVAASGGCWCAKHTDMFLRPMTHFTHAPLLPHTLSLSLSLSLILSTLLRVMSA